MVVHIYYKPPKLFLSFIQIGKNKVQVRETEVWELCVDLECLLSPSKNCLPLKDCQEWPQDWKRSVFIPIPKKGNAKECSNYHTIALLSHASKVMLKILQARLQQYMNRELPDVQAGFRQRNQRSNCHHPLDHQKSKRVPEKHLLLLYWLCQSLFPQWTVENSLRDGTTRPPDLPLEKPVCRSGSNS